VDLDAFVATHSAEWARLRELVRRAGAGPTGRRLDGAEIDELVTLYQRTATHLSILQSRVPDPRLISQLSALLASARGAITGGHEVSWRAVAHYATVTFPAAVYRSARWWVPVAIASIAVMLATGIWLDTHPHVVASIAPPGAIHQLVEHDFKSYYSDHPATDFAARVWTNNAIIAAAALALGVFLGIPTVYLLFQNCLNVGVDGGLMAASGHLGQFFGLILPHGLLELTAVFIAAGTGMRLGWTVLVPGPRRRADAVAEEGRSAFAVASGLVGVLLVSGVIEAFVTPSPLPTWARVAIGIVVEAAFLTYVFVLGSRAARLGDIGDVGEWGRAESVAVAG
jgi:uncharacterized membrane protein SpoIIM required for sporulation